MCLLIYTCAFDIHICLLIYIHCYRYPLSPAIALVEASVLVKDGNPAAADQVLTGLQSDSPVTALQAVLMRAQIAVNNDNQAQVSSNMGNDNKSASVSVITGGTFWVRGNSDLSSSPCQWKFPFSVSGSSLLFEGIPPLEG